MIERWREHELILRPGRWRAAGRYWIAGTGSVPARGMTYVVHEPHTWLLDGLIRLETDPPSESRNHYEIVPWGPEMRTLTWTSHNPQLGLLRGLFVLLEGAILSRFRTSRDEFSGQEHLYREAEGRYTVHGALFRGSKLTSSWSMCMESVPPGEPGAASAELGRRE